jgi:hypothetical protein
MGKGAIDGVGMEKGLRAGSSRADARTSWALSVLKTVGT